MSTPATQMVRNSRLAQGLPEVVADPEVLARVAELLRPTATSARRLWLRGRCEPTGNEGATFSPYRVVAR